MKKLALTTAILAATAAMGVQAQTGADNLFRGAAEPTEIRASDFMGQTLHTSEQVIDRDAYPGAQDDWENVGSIGDLILSREGQVQAVLVDVGGFLGVGSREVAINMEAIQFVADDSSPEDVSDYLLVVNTTRDALENAPEYENPQSGGMGAAVPGASADRATSGSPAATGAGGAAGAVGAANDAAPPAGDTAAPSPRVAIPEGYVVAETGQRTADELQRARVYSPDNDRIGRVSDLILDEGDQVTHIVLDIGGFLGLGAHTVALPIEEVDVFWNPEDSDTRVYVPMTREQLSELPEYED